MRILILLFCSMVMSSVVSQHNRVAAQHDTIQEIQEDSGNYNKVEGQEEACSAFAPLGEPSEFVESSQGVKLAVRRWLPRPGEDNETKSVIIFVHGGAGWHSGYSDILGRFMSANGIAVIAYDQAGSGYSESVNGLRQYFDSMDTAADDFNKIYKETKEKYPGKKVFAMGESFGCMLLFHQILKEKRSGNTEALADGYIFSGPVVKVLPEMLPPNPVISVIKFVAKFFPLLKTPAVDVFETFDLAFGDPRWAQAGRADPFIQEAAVTPPRIGTASSILSAMNEINNSLDEIDVPFKIFTGEHEARVDVAAVRRLAEESKSSDKEIEIVPGGYHQLFQDMPNVTEFVCEGAKNWVLARS